MNRLKLHIDVSMDHDEEAVLKYVAKALEKAGGTIHSFKINTMSGRRNRSLVVILTHLQKVNEPQTQSEIKAGTGLSQATVSRGVYRLENQGLIVRRFDREASISRYSLP